MADAPTYTIVETLRLVQEHFPWQVSIPLERYFPQQEVIERWLAENFDGDGVVMFSHPQAVTHFEVRTSAAYCSMGAGHYAFKDQAWGTAFRLFFS